MAAEDTTTTATATSVVATIGSAVEVDTLDDALDWAGRFAAECRCAQEVRLVMDDPEV
jgi:hypothetical protein